MADGFEIQIPGAKPILQEAEKNQQQITMSSMLARSDSAQVTNVSRAFFSVLKKKTAGQARDQLKPLSENEGLEAWRLIRANLCRKDGQRLQSEFDTLTTLIPIKIAGFQDFPTLHQRWESELTRFAAVDPEYKLGKFQKRNIIYRAPPQEIKADVDREQAHSQQLADYDELIKFVINLSRSYKYQKPSAPKPQTANLVDEQGAVNEQAEEEKPKDEVPHYTVDEWIMFLRADEGQRFLASGNPLPQAGILALLSVVKGAWNPKGKGKMGGKDPRNKGKGKDGVKSKGGGKSMPHIQCHGCGKYGHYVRDCPERSVKTVEEDDWSQAFNPSNVTLMLTDSRFHGYDIGKSNWFVVDDKNASNHNSVLPTSDSKSSNQSPSVPTPDNSWNRVRTSRNPPAEQSMMKFNVMPEHDSGCNCEQDNQWVALSEDSYVVEAETVQTVQEAISIANKPTKAQCPKSRARKSKPSKESQNQARSVLGSLVMQTT